LVREQTDTAPAAKHLYSDWFDVRSNDFGEKDLQTAFAAKIQWVSQKYQYQQYLSEEQRI
jgi:hypothetical protein